MSVQLVVWFYVVWLALARCLCNHLDMQCPSTSSPNRPSSSSSHIVIIISNIFIVVTL